MLSEHWNQRPNVPKLRSLPLFLHFYSSARLKLVLLICFIFSLFALQFVVLLSVWSCVLYLRFDSKNCPNCCSVVALLLLLQEFTRGRQFLLQGRKSISLCRKLSWIGCHCMLQACAQISMPTHMLSVSANSLKTEIVV